MQTLGLLHPSAEVVRQEIERRKVEIAADATSDGELGIVLLGGIKNDNLLLDVLDRSARIKAASVLQDSRGGMPHGRISGGGSRSSRR